jgi:hypothetical protein
MEVINPISQSRTRYYSSRNPVYVTICLWKLSLNGKRLCKKMFAVMWLQSEHLHKTEVKSLIRKGNGCKYLMENSLVQYLLVPPINYFCNSPILFYQHSSSFCFNFLSSFFPVSFVQTPFLFLFSLLLRFHASTGNGGNRHIFPNYVLSHLFVAFLSFQIICLLSRVFSFLFSWMLCPAYTRWTGVDTFPLRAVWNPDSF